MAFEVKLDYGQPTARHRLKYCRADGLEWEKEMTRVLAIITARGGSKRIPRKNIRDFLGRPIIQYSISAALNAEIFSNVMVSTDDSEIAEISRRCGAEVPFTRSTETATDMATTAEVLVEVLEEYAASGHIFDYACCLYPTAPFVTSERLRRGFNMLVQADATTLVPVARYGVPIWWALDAGDDGRVHLRWPDYANVRSQDLPKNYYDVGQFYFFNVERFRQTRSLFTQDTLGLIVPESEVQDIDNEEDWRVAELKFQFLHRGSNSSSA